MPVASHTPSRRTVLTYAVLICVAVLLVSAPPHAAVLRGAVTDATTGDPVDAAVAEGRLAIYLAVIGYELVLLRLMV